MLSWFMKSSVQSLFGNVFYLPRPDSGFSNNPFPSYHMPVTPIPSSTYALFSVTVLPQLPWNQQLPDSFYRHGGCTPARDPFFFSKPSAPAFVFAMPLCNCNQLNPSRSTFPPTSSVSSTTCNPPSKSTNSLPSSSSSSFKIVSPRVAPPCLLTSPTSFSTLWLPSSAKSIVSPLK